jgi:hypothetical protein
MRPLPNDVIVTQDRPSAAAPPHPLSSSPKEVGEAHVQFHSGSHMMPDILRKTPHITNITVSDTSSFSQQVELTTDFDSPMGPFDVTISRVVPDRSDFRLLPGTKTESVDIHIEHNYADHVVVSFLNVEDYTSVRGTELYIKYFQKAKQ